MPVFMSTFKKEKTTTNTVMYSNQSFGPIYIKKSLLPTNPPEEVKITVEIPTAPTV